MTQDRKVVVHEREWTDEFGTHYRAQAMSRTGRLYQQTVMRYPHWGWPQERSTAYDRVRVAAELDRPS